MAFCIRALLLALCLVHGNVVVAQHTSFHVGIGKLSAVAAFVSMAAGQETATSENVEEVGHVGDKAELEAEVEEGRSMLLEEGEEEGEEEGVEGAEGAEGAEEEEDDEDDQEDEDALLEEEEDEEEDDDREEDDEFEIPKPQDFMEDLDINKDNKLSLTELMTENVPKETEESMTQVFDSVDNNKDNKIDSDELPALVEEFHKKKLLGLYQQETEEDGDQENPELLMQDLDTDKDGALTFAELVGKEDEENLMEQDSQSIKEVFEASDKNKDGKLDMQELPSAMKELDKRHL